MGAIAVTRVASAVGRSHLCLVVGSGGIMQDFIATLVSLFLVEPFQAEMRERLAAARVPPEVVRQVAQCGRVATPVLAKRVMAEPWWGATTVVRVWAGATTADAVVAEAVPACGPAIRAAQPFLSDREA